MVLFNKWVDEHNGYKAEDGTPAAIAGRVFNFVKKDHHMLHEHKMWLEARVFSEIMSRPHPWVDVIGYASKLGGTLDNQIYSERRANEVKNYIAEGLRKRGRSPDGLITPQPSQGEYGKGYNATNPRDDDDYWRGVDVVVYGQKPPSVNILPPIDIDIITPLPASDWRIKPGASEAGGGFSVSLTEGTFYFKNTIAEKEYAANYVGAGYSFGSKSLPLPLSITISTDSMEGWGTRIWANKPIRTIDDLVTEASLMIVGSISTIIPPSLLWLLLAAIGLPPSLGVYGIWIFFSVSGLPSTRNPADWMRALEGIIKFRKFSGFAFMAGRQAGVDASVSPIVVTYHSHHEV